MSIQELIGKKLTKPQSKDAIHIAVAPVTASETLYPGQQVGFLHGIESDLVCATSPSTTALGIVDPFLTEAVAEGEKFFMFLLPNTVTGMRHEWEHPAFKVPVASAEATIPEGTTTAVHDLENTINSIRYLEGIAERLGISYNDLLYAGRIWIDEDEYTYENGQNYYGMDFPAFWHHFGIVTGRDVTSCLNDCPFTCSC